MSFTRKNGALPLYDDKVGDEPIEKQTFDKIWWVFILQGLTLLVLVLLFLVFAVLLVLFLLWVIPTYNLAKNIDHNNSPDCDCPAKNQCHAGARVSGYCWPGGLPKDSGSSCSSVCHAALVGDEECHCDGLGECQCDSECLGDGCLNDGDCPDIDTDEFLGFIFKSCTGIRGNCYYFGSNVANIGFPKSHDGTEWEKTCAAIFASDEKAECLDIGIFSIFEYNGGEAVELFIGCIAHFKCASFEEDIIVRSDASGAHSNAEFIEQIKAAVNLKLAEANLPAQFAQGAARAQRALAASETGKARIAITGTEKKITADPATAAAAKKSMQKKEAAAAAARAQAAVAARRAAKAGATEAEQKEAATSENVENVAAAAAAPGRKTRAQRSKAARATRAARK